MANASPSTYTTPTARLESPVAASAPDRPRAECGASTESRLEALPRLLRGVGALAMMAAASSFLLQHWENGGDVWRYYALLAHTVLLGLLGFGWGLRADDPKGARTFLALAAGLVPAHFCILGGLVYSQFSWDGPLTAVASYATWVAPGPAVASLAAALSVLALGGVTALAFVALARVRAGLLGAAYLVGNAMLLVPSRDPSVIAAMVGLHGAALVAFEWRFARAESRLHTLEGRFVRAMLFAPPVLLLARSALHYELSALYFAVSSAAVALASFALAEERRIPALLRAALRGTSLVALGATSASATLAFAQAASLSISVALPLGGVLFAVLASLLSLVAGDARWGEVNRRAAALALLATTAVDLVFFPSVVSSLAGLTVAIGTLSYGFVTERRGVFLAGVAGALLAVATHVQAAIELYALSHWGSLALVGVLVILAATGVERHGSALSEWLTEQRRRLGQGA
jgi:hypothetical protein